MKKYLPIIIVIAIGLLALVFILQRQAGIVTMTQLSDSADRSFTLSYPTGWTVTATKKPITYGSTETSEVLHIRTPDYLNTPDTVFDSIEVGAEISIYSVPAGGAKTIEERITFLTDTEQVFNNEIENRIISGVPAATYIWAVEGPAVLSTFFYHNDMLYGIGLRAARVNSNDVPEGFDPYKKAYEAVLESFMFKK